MNIFISNIAKEITKEKLLEVFSDFGEVSSATILRDKFNINSSSFGFVEMPDNDEALSAIKGLNGTDLSRKKLTVHEARIRSEDRRQTDRGGGRRETDLMPDT